MEGMGAPTTQPCLGTFSEFRPHERLVLTQVIDFLPGVMIYDSTIAVDFFAAAQGRVRMVVTLSPDARRSHHRYAARRVPQPTLQARQALRLAGPLTTV